MAKSYLIIGQGVAGTFLALALMRRGQQVAIADEGLQHSASIISAGIINPLTGKRLMPTPHYDLLYRHAVDAYQALGKQFSQTFIEPKDILRVLKDAQEKERCQQLLHSPAKVHLAKMHEPKAHGPSFVDPFGSVTVRGGGHCHSGLLLTVLREHFRAQGLLAGERFAYDDLSIQDGHALWRGEKYDQVIFCEGAQGRHNPWFKWLPFSPVKGEILRLRIKDERLPVVVLCQSKWCLPNVDGSWSAGSNYVWDNLNDTPTDAGRDEILKGLDFITGDKEVIGHQAAVRSAMPDQMPVIGTHPQHGTLGIFNGLGSKGFLMAPYYADMLAGHMVQGQEIVPQAAVTRFISGAGDANKDRGTSS